MSLFKKVLGRFSKSRTVDVLGTQIPADEANKVIDQMRGFSESTIQKVDGRAAYDYVEQIKQLKRDGQLQEAIILLERIIDAGEEHSLATGFGVAPWYYWEAAVVYRKLKQLDRELAVLERFARQKHAPGMRVEKLLERLEKVRARKS